jgi:hypothetical protein
VCVASHWHLQGTSTRGQHVIDPQGSKGGIGDHPFSVRHVAVRTAAQPAPPPPPHICPPSLVLLPSQSYKSSPNFTQPSWQAPPSPSGYAGR